MTFENMILEKTDCSHLWYVNYNPKVFNLGIHWSITFQKFSQCDERYGNTIFLECSITDGSVLNLSWQTTTFHRPYCIIYVYNHQKWWNWVKRNIDWKGQTGAKTDLQIQKHAHNKCKHSSVNIIPTFGKKIISTSLLLEYLERKFHAHSINKTEYRLKTIYIKNTR